MKDFTFFDPHIKELVKKDGGIPVVESLKHTALEYLFPKGKFSIATLDERVTAKELQENHPDGDRMLLASGKRFVYSDAETIEGLKKTLPGKINPIAYGSLLLKPTSAKNEELRVRVVSGNSDPYEIALAEQTWKAFKETGHLHVNVDPNNYLKMGYQPHDIPQLILPKSAIQELDSKVLHTITPQALAEKLAISVQKIELAPHNFVRKMKILVIDEKTGASSSRLNPTTGEYELGFDNIDPNLARSITGDGHGAISNELAASKFGTDSRTLIQMRLIAKNQDPNEVSPFSDPRVGKGTVVARDLTALGVDAVFDSSIHKGGDKIKPGIYEVDVWMGEIDRSKNLGKQSISSIIPLYKESIDDIIPVIEPLIANLSAIQNDPVAVAKSFCDDFEKRQERLKQGAIDYEDGDGEEPSTIQLLPTEKYDVIRQALDTGNVAMLQSGLCGPTLIEHVRSSYLNLALGKTDELKFNRSMIAPSKELADNEICIYGVPEGTKVIVGRAPVIGRNGIHELTVKHVGDFDYSDPNACPNYILMNDAAMCTSKDQQSYAADMGADFDGDCVFWKQSDLVPNIAIGVRAAQVDRDIDNIKLSKTEFGEDVSIEAAALQAESAPVGIIANTLIRIHSQISAINLVRDTKGVARDSDRVAHAEKIKDNLWGTHGKAIETGTPLLKRPETLDEEQTKWFDRLEKCTHARMTAIIRTPCQDLMSKIPNSDEDRHRLAKTIRSSMYGFWKHKKDDKEDNWYIKPEENLLPNEEQSFAYLSSMSTDISEQIGKLIKIPIEEPRNGIYDVNAVNQIIKSYQEIQKSTSNLILETEKELLRDMVGLVSFQSQIAVSMKKSATVAEAAVVSSLNSFLPTKTPMIKEKNNVAAYASGELNIDGITPQEIIADRVNHYFSANQLKVYQPVCFKSLFETDIKPEVHGEMLKEKLEFDRDWNYASKVKIKCKSEEGSVLKISDNFDRKMEITNLCKFSNDLAYSPDRLKGLKFKIIENSYEKDGVSRKHIETGHKYVVVAQNSKVNEKGERGKNIIGTLCEFSAKTHDISTKDIDKVCIFKELAITAPMLDISSQYFEKAKNTALKFSTALITEGKNLSEYAAALWSEITNRRGVPVNSPEYKPNDNTLSPSITHFFPDELKEQIKLQPLNIHRLSLLEGVKDLPVDKQLTFVATKEQSDKKNKDVLDSRLINIATDDGRIMPIATLWDNAVPLDFSGRALTGKIVAAGNAQMLIQIEGVKEPIVFGAVDKNFLGDKLWNDGNANISFEPVIKNEHSIIVDGESIGKVSTTGSQLIASNNLSNSKNIPVTISKKGLSIESGLNIEIPSSDKYPSMAFNLIGKNNGKVDFSNNQEINTRININTKNSHSLGVFLTDRDGIKHQIGEFTDYTQSKEAMRARTENHNPVLSINALVKAGYIKWAGAEEGGKPNRNSPPIVLKNPGEAQLMNSNQNFALQLDLNILPEPLPVIQQAFSRNFVARVYESIAPKFEATTTLKVLPVTNFLPEEISSVNSKSEILQSFKQDLISEWKKSIQLQMIEKVTTGVNTEQVVVPKIDILALLKANADNNDVSTEQLIAPKLDILALLKANAAKDETMQKENPSTAKDTNSMQEQTKKTSSKKNDRGGI
jgi:hypothetical protein